MNLPVRLAFLVLLSSGFSTLKSQNDTLSNGQKRLKINKIARKEITNRFPSTRFLDVQYEYLSPSDFKSKLHGKNYEKGEEQHQNRVKIAMNIPIYKKNKWIFTGSLRYKYSHLDFNDVRNISSEYTDISHESSLSTHFFSGGLNATYLSKMFGKIMMYNAGISVEGSHKGTERVTGNLLATMLLKRDAKTSISVGLIGIVDKTVSVPVIPFITIDQQLGHSWWLSVAMPRYLYFRKPLFGEGRLSLGSEFDGESFYYYPEGSSKTYLFRKSEIRSGFMYEHHLHRKTIVTLKGGVVNALNGRLTEKNKSANKKILKNSSDMNVYFNVGLSYNIW